MNPSHFHNMSEDKVQPTQCVSGFRKDCINNHKCIFWDTGETVGDLVSKYSAKFKPITVQPAPTNTEEPIPQSETEPVESTPNERHMYMYMYILQLYICMDSL